MRILPLILICFVTIVCTKKINAQKATNNYIVLVVEGVNNPDQAKTIDQYIRTQTGVITSRMDYRTKSYFGVYKVSSGITLDDYKAWISGLGFTVKCGRTEKHGNGNIQLLKPKDCTESSNKPNESN